mgnify:CR=1 FL=1
MARVKIHYNAPVILSFAFLSLLILALGLIAPNLIPHLFALGPNFTFSNPLDYIRVFSYTLAHANGSHFMGNMIFILLLGPILEEKYGSKNILKMILITALVTGVLHVLISSSSGLIGASGIVFMLIVLVSVVNTKSGHIPLSFILVTFLFIGKECVEIFQKDNISQLAHICGGAAGALFAFSFFKTKRS